MSGVHVGICKCCGKESIYKYKSFVKDYCSHKCSNIEKWKVRPRAAFVSFSCQQCTKQFEVSVSDVRYREKDGKKIKYCSYQCSGAANVKPETHQIVSCETCAKEFKRRADKLMEKNYCCRSCAAASRKTIGTAWGSAPDKAKIRQYMREYWNKNREKLNQEKQVWCKKNRNYRNFIQQQRRAAGSLMFEQWVDLITAAEGKCCVCGSKNSPQIDHIVPISRGGKTELSNLQVLCKFCNTSKGSKNFDLWLTERLQEIRT